MWGAIAGDIVGSVYERDPIRTCEFPLFGPTSRFTDDTVLSVAVAEAILKDRGYQEAIHLWARRYRDAGYGRRFKAWLRSPDPAPYGSYGNGSAMRVTAVGYAFDSVDEVVRQARATAEVTHDHPEGLKGAQAVALAVFLARTTRSKERIRAEVSERFGYDLRRTPSDIRPGYGFDVRCQKSVPEALCAFLEADSYEQSIRNAVSLGGDADTQATIAGGIAEAFFGPIPEEIRKGAEKRVPSDLRTVIDAFTTRHPPTRA